MKLIFTAAGNINNYPPFETTGDVIDVPDTQGTYLLDTFPANFALAEQKAVVPPPVTKESKPPASNKGK